MEKGLNVQPFNKALRQDTKNTEPEPFNHLAINGKGSKIFKEKSAKKNILRAHRHYSNAYSN